jgi:hypothetical protein
MENVAYNYDLNYFEKKLKYFLEESHPDFLHDMGIEANEFIKESAANAASILEEQLKYGTHLDIALEEANYVLTDGFSFSRYEFIEDILQEFFPIIYSQIEQKGIVKQSIIWLVKQCNESFEKFSSTDDSPYDDDLENEIIKMIKIVV